MKYDKNGLEWAELYSSNRFGTGEAFYTTYDDGNFGWTGSFKLKIPGTPLEMVTPAMQVILYNARHGTPTRALAPSPLALPTVYRPSGIG